MERLFVLVLTLVTLVTATPHGYGVKGGASAKAEASAVAGGFGDLGPLPLSIPSGSAYSGSFSKSSSSSFASSSASSSSSSFSFSGSGANGIAGIGTDKGCSTGACPGAGSTGPSLNGVQQFAGANAASAAQAKSLSGTYTPCQGSSCNGSPTEKCTSGQCLSDSALKGQNECTGNGNCQSLSSKTELPIESSSDKNEKDKHEGNINDSNDFAVNINRNPQSKLSHDSNGQYNEKLHNTESDCSNGKCGPSNYDHSGLGSKQRPHPVPSTYLTTPNLNPPCTTPNCNYPLQNSGVESGGLPSSYNVPIQSATNPPTTYYSAPSGYNSIPKVENNVNSAVPCTSPSCNTTPYNVGTSNIPNYHIGQQGPSNQGPCASGQCHIPLSSNSNTNSGTLTAVTAPNYSPGNIPTNVPSVHSGQPGCTTPHCSGLPTYSSLPSNLPGKGCSGSACSGTLPTGTAAKSPDSNEPVYTGGFGGPAGFLDITSGSNKLPGNTAYDYGQNKPGTSRPTGTSVWTPAQGFGTTNPNLLNSNNDYGSIQTAANGGSTGAFEYNKPSSFPSAPGTQVKPSPTNSYGAPTASSAVPLGTIPHPEDNGIYKPSPNHTGNSPAYSGGIHGSTGSSHINSGSSSLDASFGVTKPNLPLSTLSSPAYSHNFGGPSGAVTGSLGSTGSFNKPGSGNCGTTDCNSQLDVNVNGGSIPHDKTNPSTSSQKKPTYTGGFGGPTGFLNPNNFNVPSNTPTGSSGNVPCSNGNCDSKGSPSSNQGGSVTSNLAAATASANAVAYSGGFGGPPGVLKPYDDGKVNIPVQGNLANGHSLTSNNRHPDNLSVNGKNSKPESIPNGANAAAHASATASASAGSYGGGNNNGASRGCNSGCNPNGAVDSGSPDGLIKNGLGAGSLASAKSTAGANAYGGSYASSSASAHASAGAATKGGYGRK